MEFYQDFYKIIRDVIVEIGLYIFWKPCYTYIQFSGFVIAQMRHKMDVFIWVLAAASLATVRAQNSDAPFPPLETPDPDCNKYTSRNSFNLPIHDSRIAELHIRQNVKVS